jgi:cytochrome c peroxidase
MNAIALLLAMLLGLSLLYILLSPRTQRFREQLRFALTRQQQQSDQPNSISLQRLSIQRLSIKRPSRKRLSRLATIVAASAVAVLIGNVGAAQIAPTPPSSPLAPLKSVSVPEPSNLYDFVANKQKALELGKALFWDMQVGSDNVQSCATCHFHAGVDNRSKNQINPGLLSQLPGAPDGFQIGGAPNYQLKTGDYPFHKLSDINNRKSQVLSDTNDITSSQGVMYGIFEGQNPVDGSDIVSYQADPNGFRVSNANVRRVAPRNGPSVINAIFNYRNFWDGRAQNDFNGRNPFGNRDSKARVVRAKSSTQLEAVKISLNNASLASLATGPPLSSFEMSAVGRQFPDIGARFSFTSMRLGKKLFSVRVLGKQLVSRDDSVLGNYSLAPQKGINQSYPAMVRAAFKPEYWSSTTVVQIDDNSNPKAFIPSPGRALKEDEFTLMDYNAPLFFGLAMQLYEATLVSDDTPLDRYLAGNSAALTAQQKRGKDLFEGQGKCLGCHSGAEMTAASVSRVTKEPLERMVMGNGGVAVYDGGFYNIGVRPTKEDVAVGGTDPFGKPLSMSRLAQVEGRTPAVGGEFPGPLKLTERVAVNGSFKTPGLRNIALTAPYFHNGGQRTLKEVVDFYNRGGDFREQNIDDLDPDIESLKMTESQKQDLVAFLEGLTDDRVLYEKAPFDHPQLLLPNGAVGNQNAVTSVAVSGGVRNAVDEILELPAVGRNGGVRIDSSSLPLANFLGGSSSTASSPPPPAQAQPLAGSITQSDCPTGTVLKFVSGGYACMPGK